MTKSIKVTVEVDVDVDEARKRVEMELGTNYAASLTDDQCVDFWAESEFNYGLGCEIEILG